MTFQPNSSKTLQSMLEAIDHDDIKSLLKFIPNDLLVNKALNIGPPVSEFDISNQLKIIANKNLFQGV